MSDAPTPVEPSAAPLPVSVLATSNEAEKVDTAATPVEATPGEVHPLTAKVEQAKSELPELASHGIMRLVEELHAEVLRLWHAA